MRSLLPGRCFSIVALAGVLVASVSFHLVLRHDGTISKPEPTLASLIPNEMQGWTVKNLPIGSTELQRNVAAEMLRYDDYVIRHYERGAVWFQIYVAHWRSHAMATKLVAQHTPDNCWPGQGWACVTATHEMPNLGPGDGFVPGEYREFIRDGQLSPTRVAFWHLAGGKLYDPKEDAIGYWQWWRNALQRAARGSPEQYFVRISSNQPIVELQHLVDWTSILGGLRHSGLWTARSTAPVARSL